MARIPIYTKVDEPYAYYTVEYRTEGINYDQGLKNLGLDSNGIVIHRVTETDQANWVLYPRFPAFGKDFGWFHKKDDTFFDYIGGVKITVLTIDIETSEAVIEITASGNPRHEFYGPNTCKQGLVWREADVLDYTCVVPGRRSEVKVENQLGPGRTQVNSLWCKQGYVWREAWPRDYVCVPPASRSLAQKESGDGWKNIAQDFGSYGSFGAAPLGPVIP